MARTECTHERKGKVITDLSTREKKSYKFINEAKRASRTIQQNSGRLGNGSVVLIKPKKNTRQEHAGAFGR